MIADLQGLKDIFSGLALGSEVLDVGVNGGGGGDGGSGGHGGGGCLHVLDLLGAAIPLGLSLSLGGLAFICAMFFLATSETESFPYAASAINWGEFLETNRVHIHGIQVSGGVLVGGEGGEGQAMSFFESNDASFLLVEVDGFVHPGLEGGGDFLHRVDRGGYLDV